MKTTRDERKMIDEIRNSITSKTTRTINVYSCLYEDLIDCAEMCAYDKYNNNSDERHEYAKFLISKIDELVIFVANKECPNSKNITIYFRDVDGSQYEKPLKINKLQ